MRQFFTEAMIATAGVLVAGFVMGTIGSQLQLNNLSRSGFDNDFF